MMKATLNYSIDYLQLHFIDGRVKSAMVSDQRSIITIIDIKNDDILGVTPQDDITFNFAQPAIQLLPYLEVIDEEEAEMKIVDDPDKPHIDLISKDFISSVHFITESTLKNNVLHKTSKEDFDYFHKLEVTVDPLSVRFEGIKKIGTRFGKVYINVKDKKLWLETTDKMNAFSNPAKTELADNVDIEDLSICFDFRNFVNLTSVIEAGKKEEKVFDMKFAYIKEREGGMIHVTSRDGSEQYFLLNRES